MNNSCSEKIRQVTRAANQEGIGRPVALTFLFLLTYGENIINISQDQLSSDSLVAPRTLRAHLYDLAEEGWIDYSKARGKQKPIKVKRFQH